MAFCTWTKAAKVAAPPGVLLVVATMGSMLLRSTPAGRDKAVVTAVFACSTVNP